MQNTQILNPHNRFMQSLMSLVGQFQQELQVQRLKDVEAARNKNTLIGRPKVSFDVEQALQLRQQGFSWGYISKTVGASSGTIRRVISPLLSSTAAQITIK